MSVSKKYVDELKDIFKKEHDKDLSDDEAQEAADNLVGLVDILWKASMEDSKKKARLKKEPDGFPVEGHYSCLVCGNSINETNGWYDWYGQTCLLCRKAIKDGIVPTFVCTERDSYFKIWQFEKFELKSPTIRKMVKNGELKARIILSESGRPHEYIFLKKENPRYREFHNAVWKSHHRNHAKVAERWGRKMKAEMLAEREKTLKKLTRSDRY
jgi:hypothetical protein